MTKEGDMAEKLERVGYFLAIGAAVLAFVTGQFILALVLVFIALWGLKPSKSLSKVDEIDLSLPIPSAPEVKQFRQENPGSSLTEAIVELQKRQSGK